MTTPPFYRARTQLHLPPGLLRTNHVPTLREARRIRNIIFQKERSIEQLEVRRKEISDSLASLDVIISRVRDEIAEHKALLSP